MSCTYRMSINYVPRNISSVPCPKCAIVFFFIEVQPLEKFSPVSPQPKASINAS